MKDMQEASPPAGLLALLDDVGKPVCLKESNTGGQSRSINASLWEMLIGVKYTF